MILRIRRHNASIPRARMRAGVVALLGFLFLSFMVPDVKATTYQYADRVFDVPITAMGYVGGEPVAYEVALSDGVSTGGVSAVPDTPVVATVDGFPVDFYCTVNNNSGVFSIGIIGFHNPSPSVKAFFGDGQYHTFSWSEVSFHWPDSETGAAHLASGSVITRFTNTNGTWVSAASFGVQLPLSVSITGSVVLQVNSGVGSWELSAIQGTPPYNYAWQVFFNGSTSQELTAGQIHTPYPSGVAGVPTPGDATFSMSSFVAGYYDIEGSVTDSAGAIAMAQLDFSVGQNAAGSYVIRLTRSDENGLGDVMYLQAQDANMAVLAPSAVINTQEYCYDTGDAKGAWYDNVDMAGNSSNGHALATSPPYTWTWLLRTHRQIGANMMIVAPGQDMWFAADVTLNGVQCHVLHHFTNSVETWIGYYDPSGNQTNSESKPAAVSNLPPWLQAIQDFFANLFSPITFLAAFVRFLVDTAGALVGYLLQILGLVVSTIGVVLRWLIFAIGELFNFVTLAPGEYLSLSGLFGLAQINIGGTGLFGGLRLAVAPIDDLLSRFHYFVTAASWQWFWWAIFVIGLMVRIVHGRQSVEEVDDGA